MYVSRLSIDDTCIQAKECGWRNIDYADKENRKQKEIRTAEGRNATDSQMVEMNLLSDGTIMRFHGFTTATNSYCLIINRYKLRIQSFYDNVRWHESGQWGCKYQWTDYNIRFIKRTSRAKIIGRSYIRNSLPILQCVHFHSQEI